MQIVTIAGKPCNALTALLRSLEAPKAGRQDEGTTIIDFEWELSGLSALSRDTESIIDVSERLLLHDPESSGTAWANVAHVLGSLAGQIIDRLEHLHKGLAMTKSAGRTAPAIPEAAFIEERLRRGTFGLPERKIAFFGGNEAQDIRR